MMACSASKMSGETGTVARDSSSATTSSGAVVTVVTDASFLTAKTTPGQIEDLVRNGHHPLAEVEGAVRPEGLAEVPAEGTPDAAEAAAAVAAGKVTGGAAQAEAAGAAPARAAAATAEVAAAAGGPLVGAAERLSFTSMSWQCLVDQRCHRQQLTKRSSSTSCLTRT